VVATAAGFGREAGPSVFDSLVTSAGSGEEAGPSVFCTLVPSADAGAGGATAAARSATATGSTDATAAAGATRIAAGGWGGVFDAPVGGCSDVRDSAPSTLAALTPFEAGPILFSV
jgi:hypothetical protein